MKRILYIGPLVYGGTCLQRLIAFKELGHDVVSIDTTIPKVGASSYLALRILWRLGIHPDLSRANQQIISHAKRKQLDVIWIDKGLTISPKTISSIKKIQFSCPIVAYNPDDIMNQRIQSKRYIFSLPLYDFIITTKTFNVAEVKKLGVKNVIYAASGYDQKTHRPVILNNREKDKWSCDVGFIGDFEAERYKSMVSIAKAGNEVVVRGPNWGQFEKKHPLLLVKPGFVAGADYAKAICATKINLGFLRKASRDLHTSRSLEIPACGAFMLAERTKEHLEMFDEGKEAEFFETDAELIDKIRYYLKHETERQRIAQAGRERCLKNGYSYQERLKEILLRITEA